MRKHSDLNLLRMKHMCSRSSSKFIIRKIILINKLKSWPFGQLFVMQIICNTGLYLLPARSEYGKHGVGINTLEIMFCRVIDIPTESW